ncbi:MAG: hypothetical protein DRJ01_11520 [Bacteroidetes bacterium]|nr:MAG: hypothetical protein DRJ01_11520 [Bacteroidota bacterium]
MLNELRIGKKVSIISLLLCIAGTLLFGVNEINSKTNYWNNSIINEQRNTRNENTTLGGRCTKETLTAVDAVGDTLFMGAGEFFGVLDYSDIENPVEIGGLDIPAGILEIKIKDDYAYVVSWFAGFYVVDISDVTNPNLVYENSDYAARNYGIETNGDYLYVHSMSGLVVFDISTPANPEFVTSLPFGVTDVVFNDSLMFTSATGVGLQLGVFDNSNPTNPTQISSYYDNGMVLAFTMFVQDDRLYYSKPGENMGILDISDINDIQLIGQYSGSMPTYPAFYWDIVVEGDYAYLANANYDVSTGEAVIFDIINISNPANVTQVFRYNNPTGSENVKYDVSVSNGKAFVAHQSSGLFTFDISDPENAELSNHYQTGGTMAAVDVTDGYAYIAEGFAGLYAIDVNDPASPEFAGKYQMEQSNFIENVTANNNHAYCPDPWVQNSTTGINISDPSAMFDEFTFMPGGAPMVPLADDVEFFDNGNKALISYWDGPVFFNVADDGNLEFVSYAFIGGFQPVTNTLVAGDYVYCIISGNGSADLYVVDISNFNAPQIISSTYSIVSDKNMWSLAIKENTLFVGGDYGTIMMFDVSNPALPNNLSQFPIGEAPVYEMKVRDDYLYTAAGHFFMFEISDPTSPENIGDFYTGSVWARSLAVDDAGLIYLTDYIGGLYIISNDYSGSSADDDNVITANVTLQQNYPNPFNPITSISFSLEKADNVSLEIFNLKGQKVKTLIDERVSSGTHQVIWNGINSNNEKVSSGVYLYKLKSGKDTSLKKMILMK